MKKQFVKENQGRSLSRLVTGERLKQSNVSRTLENSSDPTLQRIARILRSEAVARQKIKGFDLKVVKKLAKAE